MVNPSEEPIDRLLSLLNHEVRTPITTLQGAIVLLKTHQLHEQSDIEGLLALAADSTNRLTRVIEDILDWCEMTYGTKSLFKQPCNIALLIQQAIEALQPFAVQRQIQMYLNTPSWVPVNGDQYYLRRALSYLLHNAIKFSPPHRQVELTAAIIDAGETSNLLEQPYVQIVVQDQGLGIPEAALEKVFHPFHQIDSSDARCHEGLGLELAICAKIIQQHQGKIWVESQLGQGSAFYIALPMSEPSISNSL